MIKYKKKEHGIIKLKILESARLRAGQLKLLSLYYRRRPQSGANKQFCL